MPATDTIAVLNRVLGIVLRSFPQYLRWSRPWVPPGHERQLEALEKNVTEQDAFAERIFEAVGDLGGRPDTGEFPMEFTDTHDLSIDYMLREAVGYGRQNVADLEAAAATPNLAPQAQLLVQEAVNTAKRQLASLEVLVPANPAV